MSPAPAVLAAVATLALAGCSGSTRVTVWNASTTSPVSAPTGTSTPAPTTTDAGTPSTSSAATPARVAPTMTIRPETPTTPPTATVGAPLTSPRGDLAKPIGCVQRDQFGGVRVTDQQTPATKALLAALAPLAADGRTVTGVVACSDGSGAALFAPPSSTMIANQAAAIARKHPGATLEVHRVPASRAELEAAVPVALDQKGVTVAEPDAASGELVVRLLSATSTEDVAGQIDALNSVLGHKGPALAHWGGLTGPAPSKATATAVNAG